MKKGLVVVVLTFISIVLMFPFYWVVISSLKTVDGMNLEPPSMYPARALTQRLTLPAAGNWFENGGVTWLKMIDSEDRIGGTGGTGAYFLQVEGGKPTKRIEWFKLDSLKPAQGPKEVVLEAAPIITAAQSRYVLVGKLVRQKEQGFNELLFVTPPGATPRLSILKDVPSVEQREFYAEWSNYGKALKGPEASIGSESAGFLVFMKNSLLISVLSLIGQVLSSSLVAYGFARLNFKGREFWFVVLLATLMIPGQVTLIPLFSVYKALGWIDSFLPLTVPHFMAGAFNVFLIRQFMLGIPRELDESAELDGANRWTVFWRVILPNCTPVLIVVGLFTFVASWQDVMGPLIYLDSPAHRTVSLGLEYFRSPYVDNRPLLMAGAVLAMLPIAGLFLIAQRYILSGIATTGLK